MLLNSEQCQIEGFVVYINSEIMLVVVPDINHFLRPRASLPDFEFASKYGFSPRLRTWFPTLSASKSYLERR